MSKLSSIENFVVRAAPRSGADFAVRLVVINVGIAGVFVALEKFLHGHIDQDVIWHLLGVVIMSTALTSAGFLSIWYLDRLRHGLAHLAATDLLTGLNNRRAFLEAAEQASASRDGVLMMLDLDHFKRINDTYGHAVGDECLRAMADMLREHLRVNDIVGRIGGEEFAVFLIDAPVDAARSIGERLSAGAEVRVADLEQDITVTASVGAVEMRIKEDLSSVLARADQAMYAAKGAGRARLVFWERRRSTSQIADPI